jgi:hypothetical protein
VLFEERYDIGVPEVLRMDQRGLPTRVAHIHPSTVRE